MKRSTFIFIIAGMVATMWAQENDKIASIVGNDELALLREKGEISRVFTGNDGPRMFPALPSLKERKHEIEATVESMNPTLGVEILIVSAGADDAMLSTYNILRSVSTLKGIEYYSATRKRMRIFYEDAYVIASPDDRKRHADPLVIEIPKTERILSFMKDSSFGEYVCSIDYTHTDDAISMEMRNLTRIWYLFIPIIDPENMLTCMIVIPAGDRTLFYGISLIKGDDVFGIAKSRSDSLYNRLKALYDWFSRMNRRTQ
jgi:hypothetical protein